MRVLWVCNIMPVSYTHLDVYKRQEQTLMDEHFLLKSGKSICFQHDLIDNNTKSLEWWINKHNWYSNKEVQDHLEKKRQMETGVTMKPHFFGGGQAERKRWMKNVVYYKTPLMRRAHSVSYTHLDVYKRQGLSGPTVPGNPRY